jgi:hypothetical protein
VEDSYGNLSIQFFFLDADKTKANASRPQEKLPEEECSNFEAGSAFRGSSCMDEKGVFGAFCPRHEYPLVFCHIFHGERYAYPDEVLAEVFRRTEAKESYVYYDIACNYIKHVKVS